MDNRLIDTLVRGGDRTTSNVFVIRRRLKHVESHRSGEVGRIEIDHIIQPLLRHKTERIFYKVAMRIDDRHALAGLDILDDHIAKQR